ncbi:hypothetical protein KEM55_001987 [Ascosphaera atra]|nr:hypothetical protein KEM55_001987 [Ascosphaera atra]
MSAPSSPRASPIAVTDVARSVPASSPANLAQVDDRMIWAATVEDGVTGGHWVENLAYAPLAELLAELGPKPLICHIAFASAPP